MKKSPTIVIIGTGFSGLCMGIRLKQAGIHSFTLLEQAGAIGGTWRDDTYPGAVQLARDRGPLRRERGGVGPSGGRGRGAARRHRRLGDGRAEPPLAAADTFTFEFRLRTRHPDLADHHLGR